MTQFDHFFILYTGLLIGIICFVFPFILSVFIVFKSKQKDEVQTIKYQKDKNLAQFKEAVVQPDVELQKIIEQIHDTHKQLVSEERHERFIKFFYDPKHHLLLILLPLLVSLGLCIIDLYTGHKFSLTYYSLIPFILALCVLLITAIIAINLIKESLDK